MPTGIYPHKSGYRHSEAARAKMKAAWTRKRRAAHSKLRRNRFSTWCSNPAGVNIIGAHWWVRIVRGWVRHARAVWVYHHGRIPDGGMIHHINFDSFDDRIENLKLMTRSAHSALHIAHCKFLGRPKKSCKGRQTGYNYSRMASYGARIRIGGPFHATRSRD
jgi:hypothetical protein